MKKKMVGNKKRKVAIFYLLIGLFTLSGILLVESDIFGRNNCTGCSDDIEAIRGCGRYCNRWGGCTYINLKDSYCIDILCNYTWEIGCENPLRDRTYFVGSKFCPRCTHGGRN